MTDPSDLRAGADDGVDVVVGGEGGAREEAADEPLDAVVVRLHGGGEGRDAPRAGQLDQLGEQLTAQPDALPGVLDQNRELGGRRVGGGAVVAGDADHLAADVGDHGLAQVVVDVDEPVDGVGGESVQRGVEAAVDRLPRQPGPESVEAGFVVELYGSGRDREVHRRLLGS